MANRSFWRGNPAGRYYASAITQALCDRLRELNTSINAYLDGDVDWGFINRTVFSNEYAEEVLRQKLPNLHRDWGLMSGTKLSLEEVGGWHSFFRRGRGPLVGWLHNCLLERVKVPGGGEKCYPSLAAWPGSREPFGPVYYDPMETEWSHSPGNFAAVERRRSLSHNEVVQLLLRSNYQCALCKNRVDFANRNPVRWAEAVEFHIDHIAPVAKFLGAHWLNDTDNLQVLCVPCNLMKKDLDPARVRLLVETGRWDSSSLSHLARTGRGRKLPV